jgi:hypothetical protein
MELSDQRCLVKPMISKADPSQKAIKEYTIRKCAKKSNGNVGTLRLKCDGTRAENRFRLSTKRTSPFKSAGASVQSTTGSRCVRISGSNAVYTMFRGSVKSTGYPLHSPVPPLLPLPCVTVCHHISTGLYSTLWNTTIGALLNLKNGILHNLVVAYT